MNEFIQVADAYYVRASSSRIDDRTHVLTCEHTFAVLDRRGDIHPHGRGQQGLYHRGTRFLSRLEVTVTGIAPLLLRSALQPDGSELIVDATNPDLLQGTEVWLQANHLHLARRILLTENACHQRFVVRSHALEPRAVTVTVHHDADFRDLFEVRGSVRTARGEMLPPEVGHDRVVLGYRGLDGVVRTVAVESRPAPLRLTPTATTFACELEPHRELAFEIVCTCQVGGERRAGHRPPPAYDHAHATRRLGLRTLRAGMARYRSASPACDAWLERSAADVRQMLATTPEGCYPHAGVPWYATVFGRDGLWTAFECLLLQPRIARGVLAHLAALQALTDDADSDAQPGKILHERRDGEMAALGEIPFGRYYGSVDATPLFVWLAGQYWRRTGDRALVQELWPAIGRALEWCSRVDERGFVAYRRSTPRGLANQGWKDSHDAVFHADGSLADGPIALCEVQAYTHAALLAGAELAALLGETTRARGWLDAADRLQQAFERHFWCEPIGTYALALDGAGRPCCVRTSNPGHCLLGELVPPQRARAVVDALLARDSWSGFGIRTVSAREPRYNPMSYHNGSVWPHDNAIIAWAMARRGFHAGARQVFAGMLRASETIELHRLPELFCGMTRRGDEGPVLYPVACSPQAWAAGAAFLLLEACLGLEVDAVRGELRVARTQLPEGVPSVLLANLELGSERVDVEFRAGDDGATDVRLLRGSARLVVQGA